METWSSLPPEVGTLSTLAGCASTLHSLSKRGGGDLRDHVARGEAGLGREERRQAFVDVGIDEPVDAALADAGKIGERDGGIVKRIGKRRPMEVAAGKHLAAGRKDERVIGCGAGFGFHDRGDVVEHVADRAMHLRHAAQAVGILNPRVVGAVRFANLAALEQCREMPGRGYLAAMRPRILNAGVEGHGSATQRLQRHCSGNIRQPDKRLRIVERQRSNGRHRLGAVQESKTFFGFKPQRSQPGTAQRFAATDAFSAIESFSFSNENQREMRQRRKIAARAHRTLFRHDGMNACVEQGDQHLDGLFAHSAEALGENVCAQQEHGADFGLGKRLAQAAGMASHQIHLQVAEAVSRNANVRELAEAGIDAVDGNSSFSRMFLIV